MASDRQTTREPTADEAGWPRLYQKARDFMARGEHSKAADILRMLALAVPGEMDIWAALAECHDADDRSDVGDALRSLGHFIQSQLTSRPS